MRENCTRILECSSKFAWTYKFTQCSFSNFIQCSSVQLIFILNEFLTNLIRKTVVSIKIWQKVYFPRTLIYIHIHIFRILKKTYVLNENPKKTSSFAWSTFQNNQQNSLETLKIFITLNNLRRLEFDDRQCVNWTKTRHCLNLMRKEKAYWKSLLSSWIMKCPLLMMFEWFYFLTWFEWFFFFQYSFRYLDEVLYLLCSMFG